MFIATWKLREANETRRRAASFNLLLHKLKRFHRTHYWPYPSGVCSFPVRVRVSVRMIVLLVFASKGAQLTLNVLPKGVKNWEESESLTQSGQVPTSNLSPVSQSATEVLQTLFSTNCSRKEDGALTGGRGAIAHISSLWSWRTEEITRWCQKPCALPAVKFCLVSRTWWFSPCSKQLDSIPCGTKCPGGYI